MCGLTAWASYVRRRWQTRCARVNGRVCAQAWHAHRNRNAHQTTQPPPSTPGPASAKCGTVRYASASMWIRFVYMLPSFVVLNGAVAARAEATANGSGESECTESFVLTCCTKMPLDLCHFLCAQIVCEII